MTRSKTIPDLIAERREAEQAVAANDSMAASLSAIHRARQLGRGIMSRLRVSARLDEIYGYETPEKMDFRAKL